LSKQQKAIVDSGQEPERQKQKKPEQAKKQVRKPHIHLSQKILQVFKN
jgi:hypothetical protein